MTEFKGEMTDFRGIPLDTLYIRSHKLTRPRLMDLIVFKKHQTTFHSYVLIEEPFILSKISIKSPKVVF